MTTLRQLRQDLGLNQTEVAERVGKRQPDVSAVELGDVPLTPDFARRLSAVYRVPPGELVEKSKAAVALRSALKGISTISRGELADISITEKEALVESLLGLQMDAMPAEIRAAAKEVLTKFHDELAGVVDDVVKSRTRVSHPDRDLMGRKRPGRN